MEQNNLGVTGRIIKLPYSKSITDDDIDALFSGLIKLIKQNAMTKSEKMYADYITKLKKEIALLKLENKLLQREVNC